MMVDPLSQRSVSARQRNRVAAGAKGADTSRADPVVRDIDAAWPAILVQDVRMGAEGVVIYALVSRIACLYVDSYASSDAEKCR
jgi:hypothetical protein